MNNYVLAMYDVQGKQEFIYRTKRIKDIEGGSKLIENCYKDYLNLIATKYAKKIGFKNGIFGFEQKEASSSEKPEEKTNKKEDFSFKKFEERIRNKEYLGEIVYEGGGNFFVLYKDAEICKDIQYLFSKKVLKKTGTLSVLCTFVEGVEEDKFNFKNKEDRSKSGAYVRVRDKHRITEGEEVASSTYGTLPIVMRDVVSSLPIVEKKKVVYSSGEIVEEERSIEAKAKAEYREKDNKDGKVLDKILVDEDDSLLAVIYIDGNNMGQRVQERLTVKDDKEIKNINDCDEGDEKKEIENINDCVRELRTFSEEINKVFVESIKDIKVGVDKRTVISAGDEVTIICDAEHAFEIAKEYLNKLDGENSSCAGIALFRSHTPFADAYRIAEECCESGKNVMKKNEEDNACYIDFHYCQGAIGISLDDIRKREGTEHTSLPWKIKGDSDKKATRIEEVEKMAGVLRLMGRSNIKELLSAAKMGGTSYELEIDRILAHMKEGIKSNLSALIDPSNSNKNAATEYLKNDNNRLMIFDIMRVYDKWFKEKKDESSD